MPNPFEALVSVGIDPETVNWHSKGLTGHPALGLHLAMGADGELREIPNPAHFREYFLGGEYDYILSLQDNFLMDDDPLEPGFYPDDDGDSLLWLPPTTQALGNTREQ